MTSPTAPDWEIPSAKRSLEVTLAQPRGFCAGVVRAIDIVERALEVPVAPVYVRHEIVHNKHDEHLMHRNPRSESIHGVERPLGPTAVRCWSATVLATVA